MFKFIKNIKSTRKELAQMRGELIRYRNWHVCKNCDTIFERANIIQSRFNFDYCATCRPIMKEKQELDGWVSQNQTSVQLLKNDIEDKK